MPQGYDQPLEGEVMDVTAIAAVTQQHEAAAMDVQVATAQALGRNIGTFQKDLQDWSCFSQEIAEECTYVLKKGGTPIVGPSIRFAELLQQAYRHIVCDTFIEEEGAKFIVVGASARDLFRNTAVRARVKRSIVTKHGKRYGPDMIQTTTQAAGSIALRNAIIRLIPKALWQGVWLKSRDVAQGVDPDTGKRVIPFSESVVRAIRFLGTFEVSEQEILAHLGYDGRAEIKADDLTLLRNKARSIRAGEVDAHAAFPEAKDETTSIAGAAAAEEVSERLKTKAPVKKAAKKKKSSKRKAAKPTGQPADAGAPDPHNGLPTSDNIQPDASETNEALAPDSLEDYGDEIPELDL